MKWLSLVTILLALETVPAISVSPGSGEPGTQIVVTGSDFLPGERLKVLWNGANLGGTARVEANGTFRYSGVVPDAAAPGIHTIQAEAVGGGLSRAETSFAVITASTSTSSTVTSTTSPTVTSAPASGVGSPTAQTTETTGSDAPETTASTGSDGESLIDTEAQRDGTTAPPNRSGDESGVVNTDSLDPDAVEENLLAVEGASNGGLIIVLALLGSVAAGTYLFWGRSKRDTEEGEADQALVPEEVHTLPPMSAADVYMHEGGWVREMLDMTPQGEITGLVARSGGFIGVGPADGEGRTSIWWSDKGVIWESVATLGVLGAAVATPWLDGMLLTISHENGGQVRTACWRSGDGLSWTQLTGEGATGSLMGVSLEGATAWDEVVVAWGRDTEGLGVWFSRDGCDWQRSTLEGGFDLIGPAGDGLLAFGRDLRERRPMVSHSADGITWAALDKQSRMVFEGASVAALTPFQGGLVAAGSDITRGSGAVWVSDDGTRWHRVPFEPEAGTSIDHLSAVGDLLLAVGTDTRRSTGGRGTPIIWETCDAISWKQVPVPPSVFADSVVNSVRLWDRSILACGTLSDERDGTRSAATPVHWRWTHKQLPDLDSDQSHEHTDPTIDEYSELVTSAEGAYPTGTAS